VHDSSRKNSFEVETLDRALDREQRIRIGDGLEQAITAPGSVNPLMMQTSWPRLNVTRSSPFFCSAMIESSSRARTWSRRMSISWQKSNALSFATGGGRANGALISATGQIGGIAASGHRRHADRRMSRDLRPARASFRSVKLRLNVAVQHERQKITAR
jgi:hypothetical protein